MSWDALGLDVAEAVLRQTEAAFMNGDLAEVTAATARAVDAVGRVAEARDWPELAAARLALTVLRAADRVPMTDDGIAEIRVEAFAAVTGPLRRRVLSTVDQHRVIDDLEAQMR